MKYTHIIWDFNGTILNDVNISFEAANQLLKNHQLPLLTSIQQYQEAFGFPIIDYYRRIGFDFNSISYDDLAHEWVRIYTSLEPKAFVFPFVFPILDFLKNQNCKQLILSATEQSMLQRQMEKLHIGDYFEEILGNDTIYAYGKESIAENWYLKHPDAKVLYIGDTEQDAKIAKILYADYILMSCGHRPRNVLEQYDALFITDNHKKILDYLQNN